jgi:hypothetical protein
MIGALLTSLAGIALLSTTLSTAAYVIDTPDTWTEDSQAANSVLVIAQSQHPFPGSTVEFEVKAFTKSGEGALFTTHVTVSGLEHLETWVRTCFDHTRRAPAEAAMVPNDVTVISWDESVEDDLAVGELHWQHTANGTDNFTAVRIWADHTGSLHWLTAECIAGEDVDSKLCPSILASLELADAAKDRGSLGAVPSMGTIQLSGPELGASVNSDTPAALPAIEGTDVPAILYQGETPPNRRYWYMGAGLLLCAAALTITYRRKRQQQT